MLLEQIHSPLLVYHRLLPHRGELRLHFMHLFVVQFLVVIPNRNLGYQLLKLLFFVPNENVVTNGIVIFVLLDDICKLSLNYLYLVGQLGPDS